MPLIDTRIRNRKPCDKAHKVGGAKSWRFKYRVAGKERPLVIGDCPVARIAKARHARDNAKAHLADGINPNEAKQREEGKSTTAGYARKGTFGQPAAPAAA